MAGYFRFICTEPRFLGFGFLLTFFSSFGQTFFISLFGKELRLEFDLSHTTYGLTYSLATLCSGLTIIYLGKKLDGADLRKFTLLLCLGMLIACLGMATAQHVAVLALAIFLLRLCGQGLLGHTALTSMSRYFEIGRGKALSVAGLGYPAGEAVLPAAVVLALGTIGWRGTWGLAGLAVLVVLVPLVLYLLKGHEERHAAHLLRVAESDAKSSTLGKQTSLGRQWTQGEVLRDLRFYLYLPGVMAPGFIMTGIFFHQGHLIESKGWSDPFFAACFLAFASLQVLSSLVAGPLVDRFAATRLMPLYPAPLALSMIIIASLSSPMSAALFMGCFGACAGLSGPIVGAMWAEVYGTRHLGAVRAMATAIMVFGTAGSPVLFGKLLDMGLPIESIGWICAVYVATGMLLALVALRVHHKATDGRLGKS